MAELLDLLWLRLADRLQVQHRIVIGIVGEPGAGKSTLTHGLIEHAGSRGVPAVGVPMDGFHLSNQILRAKAALDRKGAIDTFDSYGYLTLLKRIVEHPEQTIYAPEYFRGSIEESKAASIEIPPATRLIVTEGNYLLAPQDPWNQVKPLLTQAWFIQIDQKLRHQRLLERHLANGKTAEVARQFTFGSDEENARLIRATASRADICIDLDHKRIEAL